MAKTNLTKLVESGDLKAIEEAVQQALDQGIKPDTVLDEMVQALGYVGERFQKREIFISEMLIAAMTIQRGVNVLKPLYMENRSRERGVFIIGTVKGDLHDIGKNLVKMMLEARGFEVIDLGVDVAPETFIRTAVEQNCEIIGCSALLTTTMCAMEDVVRLADEAGIRDRVKIMVGGAPVDQRFCDKIGADAYTRDAATAADVAAALLGK